MAKRYAKYKQPALPKVESIELEEKISKKRIILFVLAFLIAIGSFYISITNLLKPDGWTYVEANSSTVNCSENFDFLYYFDSTSTKKAVSSLYCQYTEDSYKLVDETNEYDGINNIFYINHHLNEEIVIEEYLYSLFEKINDSNSNYLYYGPIYNYYDNLFYIDEVYTKVYDPINNSEVKDYFMEIKEYIDNDISLELLGNNKIRLNVSDKYIDYANKNDIVNFIDLYYLKTAFEIDYIADHLIKAGYTNGSISSYNGYVRALDTNNEYGINIYSVNTDDKIIPAGVYKYKGNLSLVLFKNYLYSEKEIYDYKEVNGVYRHKYLNDEGIPSASLNELYVYSDNKSCMDLVIDNIDLYINGYETIKDNYIYFNGNRALSNRKDVELTSNFVY